MESLFVIYDEDFKKKNTAKKIARLQAVRDKKREAA